MDNTTPPPAPTSTGALPAYDDLGGGERTWLLLHAFPLSGRIFERLAPLLAQGARVLVVDLPGLGRSAVPTAEASMDHAAAALLAVLDAAGVERADVLGISTGGYAALRLAGLAPQRVGRLVLASTTPWPIEPDVPAERRATAEEVETSRSTTSLLDSVEGGLGPTARREQPGLADLVRGLILGADPDGVAWVARAVAGRPDTSAVVAGHPREVVLLFGEEDEETPPERATQMARLRPDHLPTSLHVLPATGHLTVLERPAEVAALLGG
ncbi:alpha/beta fold hydrolase [Nocardioides sp. P86]|uniref:alpha/beta fold hydrolase n=1 Tax=Nocardioides sp. P86 TaxID=2939569 RepID=UPI00203EB189|nr:alpha/beta hydrolase [Nocardioides sp. P86]MCM3517038.1 alpha/beta hydrolase [Nocardioides sp. P86]